MRAAGRGYVFGLAIRRAIDADADTLRELWEAFTAEASYTPCPAHPFTPVLLTDNTVLVAEDDGTVVGTLYLGTANAGFGFVFGVYVVPEARRRGSPRRSSAPPRGSCATTAGRTSCSASTRRTRRPARSTRSSASSTRPAPSGPTTTASCD